MFRFRKSWRGLRRSTWCASLANLDGMAREKATFESWMAVKQQEIEKIAEVVDLCSKPEAVRPVSALLAKAAVAALGSQYLRHWDLRHRDLHSQDLHRPRFSCVRE